ncbi:MAG: hypothetical protein BGO21_20120 [Dyadobacter sp. 50-39]|uniref:hypothetical protein n=1 Tax=Dyadobacter sp. 50-39 TaxID=1895756 RepID=UPI00095EB368|nr:hypothetical protein [Dyadobacter sp. 50-39]OJV14970.1 MAG: hypothetical protein BGO21_20120 [Dyadobacter sp. 50-39]
MPKATFQLKEDDTQTVSISQDEVQEMIPDADFRFSLIMLKDGRKYFVCGTLAELEQQFSSPAESSGNR